MSIVRTPLPAGAPVRAAGAVGAGTRVRRADVATAHAVTGRPRPAPAPVAERTSRTAGVVLRAVLDHGPVARSTVARLTNLSPASVTGLVGRLVERGLLREAPEHAPPKGVGRPHVPLEVRPEGAFVIGAHIAVPHTTLAIVDLRGRVVAERRDAHRSLDPDVVLSDLADHLRELLADHPARACVGGVGLATGGWVDAQAGTVVDNPLLGWRNVPVGPLLTELLGVRVHVDGHARALVHAEQLFGQHRARARASMVNLFVGNVVDAGFATDGGVHAGPHAAAGAVAHLPVEGSVATCPCGRTGCLQAAVSEQTLLRKAVATGLVAPGSPFRALVDAAVEGRDGAVTLFRERARDVGRAAALLLDLFDPELLTVVEPGVSRVAGCLEVVRETVAQASVTHADPASVVHRTSFPGHALAVAGASIGLEGLYASPLRAPGRPTRPEVRP
jgi:predicted NBD/HSP70 family sugar kinase